MCTLWLLEKGISTFCGKRSLDLLYRAQAIFLYAIKCIKDIKLILTILFFVLGPKIKINVQQARRTNDSRPIRHRRTRSSLFILLAISLDTAHARASNKL